MEPGRALVPRFWKPWEALERQTPFCAGTTQVCSGHLDSGHSSNFGSAQGVTNTLQQITCTKLTLMWHQFTQHWEPVEKPGQCPSQHLQRINCASQHGLGQSWGSWLTRAAVPWFASNSSTCGTESHLGNFLNSGFVFRSLLFCLGLHLNF